MSELSEGHLSKVFLDEPWDLNWFCSNHKYCDKDQGFVMRMRSLASNELLFSGCKNEEINGIPASSPQTFYGEVPNW